MSSGDEIIKRKVLVSKEVNNNYIISTKNIKPPKEEESVDQEDDESSVIDMDVGGINKPIVSKFLIGERVELYHSEIFNSENNFVSTRRSNNDQPAPQQKLESIPDGHDDGCQIENQVTNDSIYCGIVNTYI
jgi:hypothetical protein